MGRARTKIFVSLPFSVQASLTTLKIIVVAQAITAKPGKTQLILARLNPIFLFIYWIGQTSEWTTQNALNNIKNHISDSNPFCRLSAKAANLLIRPLDFRIFFSLRFRRNEQKREKEQENQNENKWSAMLLFRLPLLYVHNCTRACNFFFTLCLKLMCSSKRDALEKRERIFSDVSFIGLTFWHPYIVALFALIDCRESGFRLGKPCKTNRH